VGGGAAGWSAASIPGRAPRQLWARMEVAMGRMYLERKRAQ
jgi:hypothetical protein